MDDVFDYDGASFDAERTLYNRKGLRLRACVFAGPADGESPLKECSGVYAEGCSFMLRYPMWHTRGVVLRNCVMGDACRAPLWYAEGISMSGCTVRGVKALRESRDIVIESSDIISPEFGWKCGNVRIRDTSLFSEYAFFMGSDIKAENLRLGGKYAFQYVNGGTLEGCTLSAKDAFWHSVGVTAVNCVIDGEYPGWYSEGLTLINCKISGRQPFCNCAGLRLMGCEMPGCDLAFECSDVLADIKGEIASVKNIRSGRVTADGFGEIMVTDDCPYPVAGETAVRHEKKD